MLMAWNLPRYKHNITLKHSAVLVYSMTIDHATRQSSLSYTILESSSLIMNDGFICNAFTHFDFDFYLIVAAGSRHLRQ